MDFQVEQNKKTFGELMLFINQKIQQIEQNNPFDSIEKSPDFSKLSKKARNGLGKKIKHLNKNLRTIRAYEESWSQLEQNIINNTKSPQTVGACVMWAKKRENFLTHELSRISTQEKIRMAFEPYFVCMKKEKVLFQWGRFRWREIQEIPIYFLKSPNQKDQDLHVCINEMLENQEKQLDFLEERLESSEKIYNNILKNQPVYRQKKSQIIEGLKKKISLDSPPFSPTTP